MSSYFIAATGTDIGKTFVTCALLHARPDFTAYKPVISGFEGEDTDTHKLIAAMHKSSSPAISSPIGGGLGWGPSGTTSYPYAPLPTSPLRVEELNRISPWRFTTPLSPDMAAARESRAIPFEALVAWTHKKSRERAFIETVGGVMVPLDATHTTRDWMAAARLPVILVTGSYLGTFSHTLTALEVLHAANIPVRAVILSESAESTVPWEATRETLARHTDALIVAQPRVSSYREAHEVHALAKELT